MKSRSGFTLIETMIAITLFSFVVVGFMQGLNSSILGSNRARMNNAAMDVARSQLEYVHQQDYIVHDEYGYPWGYNETEGRWEPLDPVNESYARVMDLPDGFYYDDIDIDVSLVHAPGSGYKDGVLNQSAMQQVDVTVTYENGYRSIKMVGYKAPRLARVVRGAGRYPVSKEITDMPGLWGVSDDGAQGVPYDIDSCCTGTARCTTRCAGANLSAPCHPEYQCRFYGSIRGGEGYYYVFRTGSPGPICCSWIYRDHPDGCFDHIDCMFTGCDDGVGYNYAIVFLYSGIPDVFGDEGQGQGIWDAAASGYDDELGNRVEDPPWGENNGPSNVCDDDPGCTFLTYTGTHYSSDSERYLATIGTSGDEWDRGVYTVLYHNWGYYDIGIETTSASVAYYW